MRWCRNGRRSLGASPRGPARQRSTPLGLALALIAAALAPTGCTSLRAVNTRLEQQDPNYGYRPRAASRQRHSGDAVIYLALSGGGTRAAAFAYGVFEELHATGISVDGKAKTMLDEVDTISGVSGGSFPAAYYGLFGDRIFEDFEARFLKRNVQSDIFLRALLPWNLVGLMTPWLSRSDLASRLYDRKIFNRATFADLSAARGPRIFINATDLSSGDRMSFNQDTFDVICSDLDVLPIGTAVAASSAVPVLLSPITLKNYAGSCDYEPPAWVTEALKHPNANPRRNRAAKSFERLRDPGRKRYIHLIDGAISDNLGLHPSIDFVSAAGGIQEAGQVTGAAIPDHLAFIVVNAETDPDPAIDLSAASPSFAALMGSVSGSQIRRYNFETLVLAGELLRRWARELSTPEHPVTAHMVTVGFDELSDEDEREFFKLLPTSFQLSDQEVDRLREVGRRLLRNSPAYQGLVKQLQ